MDNQVGGMTGYQNLLEPCKVETRRYLLIRITLRYCLTRLIWGPTGGEVMLVIVGVLTSFVVNVSEMAKSKSP